MLEINICVIYIACLTAVKNIGAMFWTIFIALSFVSVSMNITRVTFAPSLSYFQLPVILSNSHKYQNCEFVKKWRSEKKTVSYEETSRLGCKLLRCPKLIHWRPSLAITLVAANTPEQRFCKNCADTEKHWRLDHLGYCIIQGLNLLVTFMLKVQLHLRDILSIIDS